MIQRIPFYKAVALTLTAATLAGFLAGCSLKKRVT